MGKTTLRGGVSVAILVGSLLTASLAWHGARAQEAASSLWTNTSDSLVLANDLARVEPGMEMQIGLPTGTQSTLVIAQNERKHLGARVINAASADGSVNLHMVTQNGAAIGTLIVGDTSYALNSDAQAQTAILSSSDLSLLSSRLSEAAMVSKSSLVTDPDADKVIAWIGPEFSSEWGLASAARTQYLVEEINAARVENGLKELELVATRPVADNSSDPVFAAGDISIESADTIFADEDVAVVASVLPSSRSVRTGVTATAYATIINPASSDATECGLVMNGTGPAGEFHFQATDALNQPTGTQDALLTIPAGAAQSFVFSFASSSAQSPGLDLPIEFSCANRLSAPIISGLNTLWFSASSVDVPDIVAISETGSAVGLNTDPGVVDMLDREADGAFVVAAVNVGVSGNITVSATSTAPASFPVSLFVCQTDPSDGTCLAPPAATVSLTIGAGETPSFAVFAHSDSVLAYDPANNRVNVVFQEDGDIRGSTSVALRTLLGEPDLPAVTVDYESIIANLPAHFTGGNGGVPANADNTPVDNPVTNAGATLGRVLFYDKRLSANNTIACASCHEQALGFTDDEILSKGFEGGNTGRHSMALANARFYAPAAFFWDERAATLEEQTLMPIQDSVEMGMTLEELVPKLQATGYYPALFQAAYGDETVTSDRISKALAQFVRAIVSTNSKYDQAFYNGTPGNPDFAGTFTAQEDRGRQVFGGGQGGVGCNRCHTSNAHFSDQARNNGLDLTNAADEGAGNGRFKAPSLRNIALRGRFMHDGRFSTLEEVVEFYDSGVQNNPNLDNRLRAGNGQPRRLNLSNADKAALVAFLETLTDETLLTDDRYSDPFEKR